MVTCATFGYMARGEDNHHLAGWWLADLSSGGICFVASTPALPEVYRENIKELPIWMRFQVLTAVVALMMEAASTFEASVNYQTTRRNISEDICILAAVKTWNRNFTLLLHFSRQLGLFYFGPLATKGGGLRDAYDDFEVASVRLVNGTVNRYITCTPHLSLSQKPGHG
jgi:hypothetical protein